MLTKHFPVQNKLCLLSCEHWALIFALGCLHYLLDHVCVGKQVLFGVLKWQSSSVFTFHYGQILDRSFEEKTVHHLQNQRPVDKPTFSVKVLVQNLLLQLRGIHVDEIQVYVVILLCLRGSNYRKIRQPTSDD